MHRSFKITLFTLTSLALSLGCADQKPNTPAPEATKKPVKEAAAAPAPKAAPAGGPAYITSLTSLRKTASKDRKIEDPTGKSKKKVSNWVATLNRGEEVMVLSAEGDFLRVRASDESEGWIEKKNHLKKEGVQVATTMEEAKLFTRPDLLALNTKRKVEAGSLLFVIKAKDTFRKVNYPRSAYSVADGWLMANALATEESEVAAAKIINKIRYLRGKKDPGAEQLAEIAKSQYGSSKLIALLDKPAEEPAEGEAEEADKAEAAPKAEAAAPATAEPAKAAAAAAPAPAAPAAP